VASMNSIRDTFFEECEELLEALSEGLAKMEAGTRDSETVNAVFRAVHSIKGGAGAFALADLVAFAHRFETVLDEVRSGRIELDTDGFHMMFRSADHLSDLVAAARSGAPIAAGVTLAFIVALDDCLDDHDIDPNATDADFNFAAIPFEFDGPGEAGDYPAGTAMFDITFCPHAGLYANGHEPALLIRSLAELGALTTELDASALPDWRELDLLTPYLRWQMRLTTQADLTRLHEVFEFVEGLCNLDILPVRADQPDDTPDMPVAAEGATVETMTENLTDQPRIGPVAVPGQPAELRLQPVVPPAKASPDANQQTDAQAPNPTLRVDLERVDRLINAVGELITNQAAIAQRVDEMTLATGAEIKTDVEDYRLLARDLQEAVMAIRAQPVKPLFQRMLRIVREAADMTGKAARLVIVGESIEVDKTMIERLADPLTHMIRNAVDHGLESTEARIAAGKDAVGTISLSAAHRSGRVLITIRDDGAGLDRPKILEIARRKGLVLAEVDLADSEIDALLFLPGFSTAASVSNLSGRGVGLDVVRTAVAALGGRVSITSTPGQGTEFTISVPLTLAVMDGMVVSVAGQTVVVPIASILETIRPEKGDINRIGTSESLLSIRGRFIPVVDVARCLGFASTIDSQATPLLLLVEGENQDQFALIVDEVHDQRQVVIKGLENNYGSVAGVSAATVLGNGQIALILDTDAIANQRDMVPPKTWLSTQITEGAPHGLN
jgi:two-component system chemotaxis sensor kinase CheA